MKRRWILWVLIIAFVWLVITRFTEIQKLLDILLQGQWQWVLAAVLLQVLFFVLYAALYQAAFDTVEVESRVGELIPVLLSSWFLNVVAPSGGASTAALFADDAARRGQSAVRAAAGAVLVLLADFSSFVVVLVIGLLYLFSQHTLQLYHIIGAGALMLLIAVLSGILLLGVWQPLRLRVFLRWVQRVANRAAAWLRRRPWLAEQWADQIANEAIEASLAMVTYPQRVVRTLAVALAAHLVNIACLYALFLAFNNPIQFGPLVAGYAVGELFLIVSPTPMGIGVVEGVMVLVYNSLGVATETAAVVTLAFRGLSLWLPLFIGFFLLRRVKSFGAEEYSRAEVSSVRAVALLTALMGLINLVSAITPSGPSRLSLIERLSPLGLTHGGHLIVALAGFALLLLARGLWHRRRAAWLLTLIALDVSIVSHLLKGLDYEEAIVAGALAAWLFVLYPHFHARLDRPRLRQGIEVLVAAILYTLAYGTLGYFYLDYLFGVDLGLETALLQTLYTLGSYSGAGGLLPATGFGAYFAASIRIVGAVTLVYALFTMLRPFLVTPPSTAAERKRAAEVVQRYAETPLARLALLEDKSYFFDYDGTLVAHCVKGRVALALGDPIGPTVNLSDTVRAFRRWCASNGWQSAFYLVRPDNLMHYHAAGLATVGIAQEAVVDLTNFRPELDAVNTLRLPVNRLTGLGYRFEVVAPPLSSGLLHNLASISDEWLMTVRSSERRFSIGWFDEAYLRGGAVAIVKTRENLIGAFANIITNSDHEEVSVDLVRHRHDMPTGLLEFLYVNLLSWARDAGYRRFNLGLAAPEASANGEDTDSNEIGWSLHYLREHMTAFYRHHGSRAFKEKFGPLWSPLYLAYPSDVSLASVTVALIQANAGAGLGWGYFRERPRREGSIEGGSP
jgi:phosphatidylglycerol lysyltransferase